MSNVRLVGTRLVFGLGPLRPLVDLPPGVVKTWVRQSPDAFTHLILKFTDRVERWYVREVGKGEEAAWAPIILRARFSLPAAPPVTSPAPAPENRS